MTHEIMTGLGREARRGVPMSITFIIAEANSSKRNFYGLVEARRLCDVSFQSLSSNGGIKSIGNSENSLGSAPLDLKVAILF